MGGLALVALYGALWVASASGRSERDLVADVSGIAPPSPVPPGAEPLAAGLARVGDARASTLGLFPRYDPVALDSAAAVLAAEARGAPSGSWRSQEARLAAARVHLHRRRDLEAARVLGGLVREGGYRAPAARRLLDWVRARDDGGPEAGR